MKIFSNGKTSKERLVGKRLHCRACNTIFKIQVQDIARIEEPVGAMAIIACPHCGHRCTENDNIGIIVSILVSIFG